MWDGGCQWDGDVFMSCEREFCSNTSILVNKTGIEAYKSTLDGKRLLT